MNNLKRVRKFEMCNNTAIDTIKALNGRTATVNGKTYTAKHRVSEYRSIRGDYSMDHISLYLDEVKVATIVITSTDNRVAKGWKKFKLNNTTTYTKLEKCASEKTMTVLGIILIML